MLRHRASITVQLKTDIDVVLPTHGEVPQKLDVGFTNAVHPVYQARRRYTLSNVEVNVDFAKVRRAGFVADISTASKDGSMLRLVLLCS